MQSCSLILVAHNPIIRAGIHALLRDVPDITIVGESVDQQTLVAQLTEQFPQVVLICLDPELDQIGTELIQLCKMMQPACKVLVLAHNLTYSGPFPSIICHGKHDIISQPTPRCFAATNLTSLH